MKHDLEKQEWPPTEKSLMEGMHVVPRSARKWGQGQQESGSGRVVWLL